MTYLRDDYSGPFEAGVGLGDFSRRALARLGREYLLHGHLQDRVGIPLVLAAHTQQDMLDVAIEEWMAASPLYSRRTQHALNFGNADVPTIFKNIQLDIGAPHQFMDFRYKVDDPRHGEFWLDHCGALMDVEPMGEEFVRGMCHDIEDPTFDATAGATNPYAQVRPIHRPPRVPADRAPHCHWRVVIDPDGEPVEPHPTTRVIGESEIARIGIDDPGTDAEPGGWFDYSGEFDPDFTLEDLSHRALVVALQEVAVQTHLLAHAYLHCVASRWGVAEAHANAPQVFTGIAGVCAARLPAVLGITGDDDSEAVAKVLQLHPTFMPRTYVAPAIEILDDRTVRFALHDAPCFHERDDLSWPASMTGEPSPALDAIARESTRAPPAPPTRQGAKNGLPGGSRSTGRPSPHRSHRASGWRASPPARP